MEGQGSGAIVNTASESGLVGMGGLSSYLASKHGVVGLTKSVALKYVSRGIRVNAIAPGLTNTNIQANSPSGGTDPLSLPFDTSAMTDVSTGHIAEPEEMTGAATLFCSDDASYITGHTLPVDSGQAAD